MRIERERVAAEGWFPNWIRHEHLARYGFAASYAPGKDVVDCACGDGSSSRMLAEARAARVFAFDLAEEAVAAAAASRPHPNVRYEAADATSLPLVNGAADLYVSLETIEHLPDERAFLAEVVRVLRPRGLFICSTPDRDVYSPGHNPETRPWNRFHVREHTQAELAELLRSYFGDVLLFGQNRKSARLTALKAQLGRSLPMDAMVRVNQALKLPRLAYDQVEDHLVVPADPRYRYEIVVAVCGRPLKTTAS
jgi:ubiquinone/menaquinone biosynthesis C-methylase UbiE